MHKLRFLLIVPFVVLLSSLSAQDIHYTQFTLSPHTLNPSMTGSFEGTYRVGGMYRDQWASVLENQFITPSVYVDAPISIGGKNSWLGVGAGVVYDRAGELSLATTKYNVGIAYHQKLGSRGNTVLSIGTQVGQNQRTLDPSAQSSGSGIVSGVEILGIAPSKSWLDVNAGISLNTVLNKDVNFNLGVGAFNLSGQDVSLLETTGEFTTQPRISVHGQLNYTLNEKWMVQPSILYQTISAAQELNIQALAGYFLNVDKTSKFNFGLGYRNGDAASAIVGLDYNNFRVGLAYDFNISSLSNVSASRGGFELGVGYVGKIFKTPVVKPVIFCPRF